MLAKNRMLIMKRMWNEDFRKTLSSASRSTPHRNNEPAKDCAEPEYNSKSTNCTCTCTRDSMDRTRVTYQSRNATPNSSCGILRLPPSHYRTSAKVSLRFCLYGFIIWTLVFGPILTELARHLGVFGGRGLLGGVSLASACHPGHGQQPGPDRPRRVNLAPFQKNEFIPKMSEHTIGASGPAEGAIHKDTKRYSDELAPNFNPDIVFRDEEHTNEDRMMTKRCTDRLNVLAVWVLNQWPGIKLRVTEAWEDPDTEHSFPPNSLHYEGRAVDITTSDQDRSKYPILARLAVEAGFDWVQYKNTHVHCSVKSDSSDAAIRGGCFPGDSIVELPGGKSRKMEDLRPGDEVLSFDSGGKVVTDTILTFMDVQSDALGGKMAKRAFVSITTEDGTTLRLTRNHLIYVSTEQEKNNGGGRFVFPPRFQSNDEKLSPPSAVFAGNVKVGQFVYVISGSGPATSNTTSANLRPSKITKVEFAASTSGAFAPLTSRGTIVVDGTAASCYAVIESDYIAHAVMTPIRYFYVTKNFLSSYFVDFFENFFSATSFQIPSYYSTPVGREEGISLYSRILFDIGSLLFSDSMFWGD